MVQQKSTFNNTNWDCKICFIIQKEQRFQLKVQKQFILFLAFQHMLLVFLFFCSSNYGVHSLQSWLAIVSKTSTVFHISLKSETSIRKQFSNVHEHVLVLTGILLLLSWWPWLYWLFISLFLYLYYKCLSFVIWKGAPILLFGTQTILYPNWYYYLQALIWPDGYYSE